MCVRERDSGAERERERERESVCVCVCVGDRERDARTTPSARVAARRAPEREHRSHAGQPQKHCQKYTHRQLLPLIFVHYQTW